MIFRRFFSASRASVPGGNQRVHSQSRVYMTVLSSTTLTLLCRRVRGRSRGLNRLYVFHLPTKKFCHSLSWSQDRHRELKKWTEEITTRILQILHEYCPLIEFSNTVRDPDGCFILMSVEIVKKKIIKKRLTLVNGRSNANKPDIYMLLFSRLNK